VLTASRQSGGERSVSTILYLISIQVSSTVASGDLSFQVQHLCVPSYNQG